MLHKFAKVVNKEYVEYTVDEGPAEPISQDDKSREAKNARSPLKTNLSSQFVYNSRDFDLTGIASRGMRLA
jgi:hypothetical protein